MQAEKEGEWWQEPLSGCVKVPQESNPTTDGLNQDLQIKMPN